ncbi:MAG TPA: glycoside hydrolase family 5 protein, partial [Anaerolineae bacterium]
DWGVTLEEVDFQLIKNAGFNSVRIPIRWSAHALKDEPYTIDPPFMARVDWTIEQAFTNGLAVVINMHNYDEFMAAPAEHEARYLAIWRQIASHYKNYAPDLFFEPYNEPHGLGAEAWNQITSKVVQIIRAINPTRAIIVSPLDYDSHRRLADLKLPLTEQNLIVAVHYYLPFQFTHQGAEWVEGSSAWMGTQWVGNSNDTSNVDFDFQVMAQWARENARPIYLGEFGAYSKADMASRSRWTTYVARAAEANQFSWSYWEFRAGFGIYNHDTKTWNEPLRKALIPNP